MSPDERVAFATRHLPLVALCAKEFRKRCPGHPSGTGDLIQEGWIKLHDSAHYYDPARGKPSTFINRVLYTHWSQLYYSDRVVATAARCALDEGRERAKFKDRALGEHVSIDRRREGHRAFELPDPRTPDDLEARDEVDVGLRKLGGRDAELLRDVYGIGRDPLSLHAAAAKLGIKYDAACERFQCARRRFKERMTCKTGS